MVERSYYHRPLSRFDVADATRAIGELARSAAARFASTYSTQIQAWDAILVTLDEVRARLLSRFAESGDWHLFLEFEIPRRQKRPDVVLLASGIIFVIEFKIGAIGFDATSEWQAMSYALDLRDFHEGSASRTIVPFLVVTSAAPTPLESGMARSVWPLQRHTAESLADGIITAFELAKSQEECQPLDAAAWSSAPYRPSLTIIQAAERLYSQHSVREISHSYADNLNATTQSLVDCIRRSSEQRRRSICFVTGVPGAGKTLTGLNAVHDPEVRSADRPAAVFLSGNRPLVQVVREALKRNARDPNISPQESKRRIEAFVQFVHQFLREYAIEGVPPERVIVFDEAQRAWNAEKYAKKMKSEVVKSEAELVFEIMERCPDWCVVIALVGGGQEIHNGEAGLAEWGAALAKRSEIWDVYVSPEALDGGPSLSGSRLFQASPPSHLRVTREPALHLTVSTRSHRAQIFAEWVNAVLNNEPAKAAELAGGLREFPIAITRSLNRAREWLRMHTDPERRSGLVASSGALRLRRFGVEVSSGFRSGIKYEMWFLNGAADIRSSSYLEITATEFEVQGLEIDWVGVCWGSDLSFDMQASHWRYRRLNGSRMISIKDRVAVDFLRNKYRVLLTRAREGIILWIPPGATDDPTNPASDYDGTAEYLAQCGLPLID